MKTPKIQKNNSLNKTDLYDSLEHKYNLLMDEVSNEITLRTKTSKFESISDCKEIIEEYKAVMTKQADKLQIKIEKVTRRLKLYIYEPVMLDFDDCKHEFVEKIFYNILDSMFNDFVNTNNINITIRPLLEDIYTKLNTDPKACLVEYFPFKKQINEFYIKALKETATLCNKLLKKFNDSWKYNIQQVMANVESFLNINFKKGDNPHIDGNNKEQLSFNINICIDELQNTFNENIRKIQKLINELQNLEQSLHTHDKSIDVFFHEKDNIFITLVVDLIFDLIQYLYFEGKSINLNDYKDLSLTKKGKEGH